jgi:hypothetical protein
LRLIERQERDVCRLDAAARLARRAVDEREAGVDRVLPVRKAAQHRACIRSVARLAQDLAVDHDVGIGGHEQRWASSGGVRRFAERVCQHHFARICEAARVFGFVVRTFDDDDSQPKALQQREAAR